MTFARWVHAAHTTRTRYTLALLLCCSAGALRHTCSCIVPLRAVRVRRLPKFPPAFQHRPGEHIGAWKGEQDVLDPRRR